MTRLKEVGGLNFEEYVDLIMEMMSEDPGVVAQRLSGSSWNFGATIRPLMVTP